MMSGFIYQITHLPNLAPLAIAAILGSDDPITRDHQITRSFATPLPPFNPEKYRLTRFNPGVDPSNPG